MTARLDQPPRKQDVRPPHFAFRDNKPAFLSVSELLKHSAAQTKDVLCQELEMKLGGLDEKWHFSSFEKIFIENRIYRNFDECTTWDAVMAAIWKGLDDGTVRVSRVTEKAFFGANPIHVALFNKEATPVYNLIYRDGARGRLYAKRFTMGGVTRDTVYDLIKGAKGSKVFYFAVHPTEAISNTLKVVIHLQPAPRLRKLEIEINMVDLPLKARTAPKKDAGWPLIARIGLIFTDL